MIRRTMLACLFLLTVSASPAFATPIAVDNSFHEFFFGATGSFATSCGGGCAPTTNPVAERISSPPWTFSGAATLFILDLFLTGDRFEVFDFGASLGLSSLVGQTGDFCGANIACATADERYSRGMFALAADDHSITIRAALSPFDSGDAVFSVGPSQVPQPMSLLLIGTGLVGLAGAAWRRRRKQ